MNGEPFQTDLEISQECDKLLEESIIWSMNTFGEYKNPDDIEGLLGKNFFTSEDIRAIGISRFIYLQGKLFNHSDKWHRDQDLKKKNVGGTPIIRKEE